MNLSPKRRPEAIDGFARFLRKTVSPKAEAGLLDGDEDDEGFGIAA